MTYLDDACGPQQLFHDWACECPIYGTIMTELLSRVTIVTIIATLFMLCDLLPVLIKSISNNFCVWITSCIDVCFKCWYHPKEKEKKSVKCECAFYQVQMNRTYTKYGTLI